MNPGEVGDLLCRATQASSGMFIVDADRNGVLWDEESRVGFTAGRWLRAPSGEVTLDDEHPLTGADQKVKHRSRPLARLKRVVVQGPQGKV